MPKYEYVFWGKRSGKSDKGDFYVIKLIATDLENDNSYEVNCYVDAVIYAKADSFQRFQPVECMFAPTSTGKAKLVYLAAS